MRRKSKKQKLQEKEIAQDHVHSLSEQLAQKRYTNPTLAQRYFSLVRRIAMRFRLPLPKSTKYSACKWCKTLFRAPENCRVRLQQGKVVYLCYSCKGFTRLAYKPLKKKVQKREKKSKK